MRSTATIVHDENAHGMNPIVIGSSIGALVVTCLIICCLIKIVRESKSKKEVKEK